MPPRFASSNFPASPQSISHSPHSIKSSPSSENAHAKIEQHHRNLLDAAIQSPYISPTLQARGTVRVSTTGRVESTSVAPPSNHKRSEPGNREHFPIGLTPPTHAAHLTEAMNSCESGQSRSSSTYDLSPRSKRPRRTSMESNNSDSIHKTSHTSVIQPTHHLSTSHLSTSAQRIRAGQPQVSQAVSIITSSAATQIPVSGPSVLRLTNGIPHNGTPQAAMSLQYVLDPQQLGQFHGGLHLNGIIGASNGHQIPPYHLANPPDVKSYHPGNSRESTLIKL